MRQSKIKSCHHNNTSHKYQTKYKYILLSYSYESNLKYIPTKWKKALKVLTSHAPQIRRECKVHKLGDMFSSVISTILNGPT